MTMEEIARDMGVSRSTVSRALSGKGRIGEDTRARIREYVGRQSEAENQSTNNLAVVLLSFRSVCLESVKWRRRFNIMS